MGRWQCAAVGVLCVLGSVSADTLKTKSGETIAGKIVAEDSKTITVDIGNSGIAVTRTFPRPDIASIEKEVVPAGPRYFEIPIMGVVGQEITADSLKKALAAGRAAHATHIILLINSHGGAISEMESIVEVMQENKDLQTIAFVRNAHSAAAVIAGTCKTIVMHPMGQIGAAVPYLRDASGNPKELPKDVNEKLSSAVRALVRTATTVGGHRSELFMGMIDPDMELYYSDSAGKVSITEEKRDGATCIKRQGKILTMNADEAVKYGLASGPCKTIGELRTQIGISEWSDAGRAGWDIFRQQTASQQGSVQADRNFSRASDQTIGYLTEQLRLIRSEINIAQKYIDELDQQRNDSRISSNPILREDLDKQRRSAEFRLSAWRERETVCRKQIEYVKGLER